ncbi:MAG: ribosome recycling factor [Deltaproteobacteria bacterium]|nr:ribosome recycling factor [Deltaproteobacteria bacterium]
MSANVLKQIEKDMNQTIESFSMELKKIRTGRASAHLLEGVRVAAYGSMCPLNQVAQIAIPESKLMTVQPFDPSILSEIEKAITLANLGVSPTNDGKIIRIPMPPLSQERRLELVKIVKRYAEESRVSIRHHRREANDSVKKFEKSGEIAEDESRKLQKQIQDLTDASIKKVDDISSTKEAEIMKV